MAPLKYLKRLCAAFPEIARSSGYTTAQITWAFVRCFFRAHVHIEEFRALRMYELSNPKLATYLTTRRRDKLTVRYFDRGATAADHKHVTDKQNFNRTFHEFVHRDWLYIPDATQEDIRAFVLRSPTFLAKATDLTQGQGITLHQSADTDPDAFAAAFRDKPVLLEAYIRQHPAMAALNPSSINSVRVITARYNGKIMVVGAGLRIGGQGSFVDNFHNGGTAYPLDVETGIVTGPGQDIHGQTYLRTPSTGHVMPGFQVPHWDMVIDQALRAALIPERIGYVGWDVAITEEGVDFIECNTDPGCNIIQLDGRGAYKRLTDFIKQA